MNEKVIYEKKCSGFFGDIFYLSIHCKSLKNGNFSLRLNNRSENQKKGHFFKTTKNIKDPKEFIKAIFNLDGFDPDAIEDDLHEKFNCNLLPKLYSLSPLFALSVLKVKEYEDLDEEGLEVFESKIDKLSKQIFRFANYDTKRLGFPSGLSFPSHLLNYIKDFILTNSRVPEGDHFVSSRKVSFPLSSVYDFDDINIEDLLYLSFSNCIFKPSRKFKFDSFKLTIENSTTYQVVKYIKRYYKDNNFTPKGEHEIAGINVNFK